jgi:pimeloyl-[acyl-carrier protein] methyl ester esterase
MPEQIGSHWLLLRGLSRESGHWGDFLSLLQAQFPSADIQTVDLPGTGNRYLEDSPASINAIMLEVRAEAAAKGMLNQPLTLLGLSLGGMVAWEWQARFPQETNAAVLINSSMASLSPFYHRLRWQSYPNFFKLLLQPNRYRKELAIIRCVANRRENDQEIAGIWARIQAERPVRAANTLRQLAAAAHYRPEDKKPAIPILLLNARCDRLVAPDCSAAIRDKWQLTMATHDWAGHDLPLDDGAWVAANIRQWLTMLATAHND